VKKFIEKAYPQVIQNSCLEMLTDSEFSIYDSEMGRCFIQKEEDEIVHFTVKNPKQKEIGFLAIDKCIFMDNDKIKRCDCAVFDNKTLCFIEIKETTHQRKSEYSRKAKEQLLATIVEFSSKIDFSGKRLEAYVVVGLDFKRIYPASKSQDLLSTLQFERLGVTLFHDGNEKKFR
jgi:hypothetical protein